MDHEKWLVERYRSALREYEIAQNHFEYCELAYVDYAIDDLIYAEKNFKRALKELRDGMDETVLKN